VQPDARDTRCPIRHYDAALRAFQGEQGLPALDWSRQAVERVKDPETPRGRDRLREALAGLGFALR
jgi:hypothetical protein